MTVLLTYKKININKFLVFCFFVWSELSCASGIEVIPDSRYIESNDENIVTLSFNIRNTSSSRLEFIETVSLPDDWKLLTQNSRFQLSPGEDIIQLVHIVTNESGSGEYPVSYSIEALETASIMSKVDVIVNIKEVIGLELKTLSIPDRVILGEKFSAKVRVLNTGNIPLNYNLKILDEFGYIDQSYPKNIYLESGEKKDITINFLSLEDSSGMVDYRFRIIVNAVEKSIREIHEEKILLLSKNAESVGGFYTLPGNISTAYIMEESETGNILNEDTFKSLQRKQLEIRAGGHLDAAKTKRIDFLVRTSKDSAIGEYSSVKNYTINYKSKKFKLNLGHQVFKFNYLIENNYNGFGLNTTWENKKWLAHYMVLENREDALELQKSQGIRITRKIGKFNKLSLGFFSRENEDNIRKSYIGLDVSWKKGNLLSDFEYWRDKNSSAFYFKLGENFGKSNYQISSSRQYGDFEGVHQYSSAYDVHLGYSFNQKLNLTYDARWRKNNPISNADSTVNEDNFISLENDFEFSQDDEGARANINARQNLSLAYDLDNENNRRFTLGIEESTQKGDSEDSRTTYRLLSRYQQNFLNKKLKLDSTLRKERQYYGDNLSGVSARLNVSYLPSDKLRLGFTFNSLSLPEKRWQSKLQGTYTFGWRDAKLTVVANHEEYQNRRNTNDEYRINFDYPFKNGHQLSFSLSNRHAENPTAYDKRSSFFLSYSIPFGVPFRKRAIGSVHGRIYDEESGDPVENAIVSVNNISTVSDERGEFSYPGIDSGEHQLIIDTSFSDKKNMIPRNGDNEKILIEENEVESIDIALYHGGELRGKVLQYGTQAKSLEELEGMLQSEELKEKKGVADVLMTLVYQDDDSIVHKTITQSDGSFSFFRLLPGKWVLEAQPQKDNDKQGRYFIKKKKRIVEIRKQHVEEVEIQAVPRVLGIQNAGPSGGMRVTGS